MDNASREQLIAEIEDWTQYTPAGEYTTIRKVLLMLVDLAFPIAVDDWEAMIEDIRKDPKKSRRYLISNSPNGEDILYEFIPGIGVMVVASELEEDEENILS